MTLSVAKAMKWDSAKGCPIPGTYKPLNLPGSLVMTEKKKCEATKNGLYVPDTIVPYFEDEPLTIDDFFLQRKHRELQDIYDMEVLLLLSSYYRSEEMKLHIWDVIGGLLDFPRWDEERCDVPCRLYFCDSVEDIWDMLLDGIGNPRDFVYAYGGFSRGYEDCRYGEILEKRLRALTFNEERLRRYILYMTTKHVDMKKLLFDTI